MFPEGKERSRNNPIVRVYFRILVLLVCVYGSGRKKQRIRKRITKAEVLSNE